MKTSAIGTVVSAAAGNADARAVLALQMRVCFAGRTSAAIGTVVSAAAGNADARAVLALQMRVCLAGRTARQVALRIIKTGSHSATGHRDATAI